MADDSANVWLWLGNDDQYLDDEGEPIDFFQMEAESSQELIWSCTKKVEPGDLALLYWTGSRRRPGYGSHIQWVCLVTGQPFEDPEWGRMCTFTPLAHLETPVSITEMKQNPVLAKWGAIKTNLRGFRNGVGVPATEADTLLDILVGLNPGVKATLEEHWKLPQSMGHGLAALVDEVSDEIDPFDPKNLNDRRRRVAASIAARRGQAKFRKQLIQIYDARCIISVTNAIPALEAAHIIPFKGDDSNHPGNGLLLRSDLHTLFDLGLIGIDPDELQVVLAASLLHTTYADFVGLHVNLPHETDGGPSREALRTHLSQVDGRVIAGPDRQWFFVIQNTRD